MVIWSSFPKVVGVMTAAKFCNLFGTDKLGSDWISMNDNDMKFLTGMTKGQLADNYVSVLEEPAQLLT